MDEFAEQLAVRALDLIGAAFAARTPPSVMSDSKQLLDFEYDEVMSFAGMDWRDVTHDQVVENSDAVFWFSPEAFPYYLPGVMTAGLRARRTDANAYDSLIGMLDRGGDPGLWDEFFLPRWPSLTISEIEAVGAWTLWFEAVEPEAFRHGTYERVQATLDFLRERAAAGG